jgi:hypothetical protein
MKCPIFHKWHSNGKSNETKKRNLDAEQREKPEELEISFARSKRAVCKYYFFWMKG